MNCNILFLTFLIPFCLFAVEYNPTDTLFQRISQKSISQMTDGEFRYFFPLQKNNKNYDRCHDPLLNELKKKLVSEMNQNEFDYFIEFVFSCFNC